MNHDGITELKPEERSPKFDLQQPNISQAAAGGFLILMGTIVMMGIMDMTLFGRSAWWLIPLLPAYWIGFAAYRRYREDGRFTSCVLAIAFWGLLPFVYLVVGLLGFKVGALWPLSLIVIGISFLLFGPGK